MVKNTTISTKLSSKYPKIQRRIFFSFLRFLKSLSIILGGR